MRELSLFVVASVFVSACGSAPTPVAEAPKPYETRSATPPAPAMDVETLKLSQQTKADTFAKSYAWTETPSLETVPRDAIYGAVGSAAFVIRDVEIQVSEQAGTWTLRARGGESGILGPSITAKGVPSAGQTYTGAMGSNPGFFQSPRAGRGVGTKDFSETLDLTTDNAFAIEITKLSIAPDGKSGKASGRLASTYKAAGDDYPAMWAAGTFEGANVRIWKN